MIVSLANGDRPGANLVSDIWSGYFRSYKVQSVFYYNFLHKQDRAMRMILLCSADQYASIDMHIDLLWSPADLRSRDLSSAEEEVRL